MYSQLPFYAACLAQVASASWLHQAEDSNWLPPRQTSEAEQAEKSLDSVSPAPTSRPEDLAEMELFKRQTTLPDYTLASDTCGFYVGFSTNSYTCAVSGQRCQTLSGNTRYRGCCSGTQCSTIATTCIPSSRFSSGQSCGTSTTCCSQSSNPQCGTIFYSSLRNPSVTQTIIQCWATNFRETYSMQDIPPSLLSAESETSSTTRSTSRDTTTTSRTTPALPGGTDGVRESDSNAGSNNVGAIVGGVVGGVAGIALIVGAVVFFLLRKKRSPKSPSPGEGFPPGGAPPGGPIGGPSTTGSPPPLMVQGAYAPAPMSQYDATKPPGQQQFYDPRYTYMPVDAQHTGGYAPSSMNGSHSPQPTYANSMHSPNAYAGTVSQITPPQGHLGAAAIPGQQGGYPMGPPSQQAYEMPAHNPIGSEGNRAEMWSGPPESTQAARVDAAVAAAPESRR